MANDTYYFFTDGATSKNGMKGATGGWAWIRVEYEGGVTSICNGSSGGEDETTNNRCELLAVINACKFAESKHYVPAVIYSDSAYCVNAFNQDWIYGWVKKNWKTADGSPVKNKEIWQEIYELTKKHKVTFHKVKGHSDVELNNRCDELARGEIDKLQKGFFDYGFRNNC